MTPLIHSLVTLTVALQAYASTLPVGASVEPKIAPNEEFRVERVISLIETYGSDLSENTRSQLLEVAKCESGLNPSAWNEKEDSVGLFQINLPSWPDITREQALDPDFSTKFAVKHFKEGNQRYWSCWKDIYAQTLQKES